MLLYCPNIPSIIYFYTHFNPICMQNSISDIESVSAKTINYKSDWLTNLYFIEFIILFTIHKIITLIKIFLII
jgi:hypothetical protein